MFALNPYNRPTFRSILGLFLTEYMQTHCRSWICPALHGGDFRRPGPMALRRDCAAHAVPSPGNIYVIQILQFTPAFGSVYDIYIGRSRYFMQLAQMVLIPTIMQLVPPHDIPKWIGYTSSFMSINKAIAAYPLLPLAGQEQQGKVWSGAYLQANAALALCSCIFCKSQSQALTSNLTSNLGQYLTADCAQQTPCCYRSSRLRSIRLWTTRARRRWRCVPIERTVISPG